MNENINQNDSSESALIKNNENIVVRKAVIDKLGRSYATGKRKNSVARVWIKEGSGKILVNKNNVQEMKYKYIFHDYALHIINFPFLVGNVLGKFDVWCTTKGGGFNGQLESIKYGIAKALVKFNPVMFHKLMREAGLLTRDARIVESKKYGRKKARKSFQFSKR